MRKVGGWWIADSDNFQVCSYREAEQAEAAAVACERHRRRLAEALGLGSATAAWAPKCQAILHPTVQSYVAAAGRGAEATVGSSLVQPARGRITARRIDLRIDVKDYLDAALPHEICHLLIADHYRDEPPPLWYDEGLALLADPAEKLARHERDLRDGVRRGISFSAREILAAQRYPPAERMGVFYGQCASLTRFLLRQEAPAKLHQLVRRSREIGPNAALQAIYGVAGVGELERQWSAFQRASSEEMLSASLLAVDDGKPHELSAVQN
ncbi:MAG: hypothetical protein IT424_09150 [Pirellulales bacterium]|nr:hypothetical protein [Pirellulales bacterium]